MKHILIGTAGHIDHGKTALIRALTGIEADRLAEEKKRGITIDLGFAYLPLPGGGLASIVDVPGHDKFIKNMLAGAGGIDLVLLVVAADDGIMPQTREHMDILQLLNAKSGIIAVTKCDLADEEWRGMVAEDVKAEAASTFLENAPLIFVSSHTGEGLQALKECIYEKIEQAEPKNISKPFRIPIDRVFSVDGFGTVVTGTLTEGTLHRDGQIEVFPAGLQTRARNIQVHDKDQTTAYAGQRVAVNLAGLHHEELKRGDVLAPPGSLSNSLMLDVKLELLKNTGRELKNNARVHFHYGTRSVVCKVALLGEGYAQLRFAEEVNVKKGDRFVIRFYSPTDTIGGGVVLHPSPQKHRRGKTAAAVAALKVLEQGTAEEQILQAITEASASLAPLSEIKKRFGDCEKELETLEAEGQIRRLGTSNAIASESRLNLTAKISELLTEYHKENPLQAGIRKEELRSRVLPDVKPGLFDQVIQMLTEDGALQQSGACVALPGFRPTYSEAHKKIRSGILARVNYNEFVLDKAERQVFDALVSEGAVIVLEQGIVFEAGLVDEAKTVFVRLVEEDGGVSLAQFRDALGTSRKFALAVLEYFDRAGVSRKVGDVRVMLHSTNT